MAMLPAAELFLDKVNLIIGPGKACGKTLFAKAAALSARAAGGRLALMAVGAEGGSAGRAAANEVGLEAGEVFVTAERLLPWATCLPTLLEALPGMSALGRIIVARAARRGRAALAGPERNDFLALAARLIIEEGWASTVIIDGAFNRITQMASLEKARLFYAVAADKADCRAMAAKLGDFLRLVELPEAAMGKSGAAESAAYRLPGPLTASAAERIPERTGLIVIDDFSKVFLEGRDLAAFLRRHRLAVMQPVDFGGFSVALRGIRREAFEGLLGEEASKRVVSWNAYAEEARDPRGIAAKCGMTP
jgi:hypothetical protein